MRTIRLASLSVFAVAAACSSAPSSEPGSGNTHTGASAPGDGLVDPALSYFDGTVDPVRGTMEIATRLPGQGRTTEITLPYGTSSGDVYFHTCSTSTTATTYGGTVTAINLLSSGTSISNVVTTLNAVIDSISETGVTLATGPGAGSTSGIIAQYGSVSPNSQNCTSPTTWTFNIPGPAQFTFSGHATGYVQGLVAYWSFNEGSGTTFNDSSGNGQTATATSGSFVSPGEGGSGSAFSGYGVTNAAMPLGNVSSASNAGMTISAWATRTGAGLAYPRLLDLDANGGVNGFEIADYNHNGDVGVWNGSTWYDTGLSWGSGSSYVHVVVTANSSALNVYLNGASSGLNPISGETQDLTGLDLWFGQRGELPASETWVGSYDEVRVYNRVLSASEIAALP